MGKKHITTAEERIKINVSSLEASVGSSRPFVHDFGLDSHNLHVCFFRLIGLISAVISDSD